VEELPAHERSFFKLDADALHQQIAESIHAIESV
jgi:hypothetical protein